MSPIAKWGPIFGFEQIVTIIFSAKAKWTCSFLRIASRRFLPRSAPALWKKSCYQKDFAEQEFTFFEALLQNLTSVPPIACSLQWTGTRGPLRQNLWDLNFLPSPLCPSHAPGWFSEKPKFHHKKNTFFPLFNHRIHDTLTYNILCLFKLSAWLEWILSWEKAERTIRSNAKFGGSPNSTASALLVNRW